MFRAVASLTLLLGCSACGAGTVSAPSQAIAVPVASIEPGAARAPTEGWERCGELDCRRFDRSSDALRAVLQETHPRILAIGESHAPKGSEGVPSVAARTRDEWLSVLPERTTDLVVELVRPPEGCDEAKRDVIDKVERPVTASQRSDNRNDVVELANHARQRGMEPWALEPSCAEMRAVADAADGPIDGMLRLIAERSLARLRVLDERRPAKALIVAYGGALHNDRAPQPERASWTFGPRLAAELRSRYVELDAFAPEHIRDTESWRRMPWYRHHDPNRSAEKTTLYRMGPASFVIVFGRAVTASGP